MQSKCVTDQDPPMSHPDCKLLLDNDRGKLLPQKHTTQIYVQDPKTKEKRFCPSPGVQGESGWCEILPTAVSYCRVQACLAA